MINGPRQLSLAAHQKTNQVKERFSLPVQNFAFFRIEFEMIKSHACFLINQNSMKQLYLEDSFELNYGNTLSIFWRVLNCPG